MASTQTVKSNGNGTHVSVAAKAPRKPSVSKSFAAYVVLEKMGIADPDQRTKIIDALRAAEIF